MTNHNIQILKSELRQSQTKLRNTLSADSRLKWSAMASQHASQFIDNRGLQKIMVYLSIRSELNLRELIEWCWSQDREVIVPKCHTATHRISLHSITSMQDVEVGSYGILEPDLKKCPELPQAVIPDVVFVPGLAFDLAGGRLGYGGGYYDRMSTELRGRTIWIGACYEAQLVTEVPLEGHDLRLQGVLTESNLYNTIG